MSEHWSDLPDDLLHLVYNKVTGLRHRVCFAAVCTQWRATAITARHEAPPTLPWLVFSTSHDNDCKTRRAYCPEDGGVMRIPLPSALIGKRVVGAHDDGWVAALGDNMQLVVVNLFSGAEVPLPAKDLRTVCSDRRSNVIWKVVFSESPTSSGCILAAITPEYGIALCRLGFPDSSWMSLSTRCGPSFMDITFCSGQLYGKFCYQNIVKFEIGVNKDGGLVITGEPQRLHIRWHSSDMLEYPNNIVELHGKLAMVGRTWSHGIRRGFKVFELVDESSTEYDYKWEEVTSLGDYALFLGTMWSKVVYMPAAGRGRVQTNCIYADDATYLTSLDGHGDPVYPMLDKSNDDVTQWIKTAGCNVAVQSSTGTWVLPPDF